MLGFDALGALALGDAVGLASAPAGVAGCVTTSISAPSASGWVVERYRVTSAVANRFVVTVTVEGCCDDCT